MYVPYLRYTVFDNERWHIVVYRVHVSIDGPTTNPVKPDSL